MWNDGYVVCPKDCVMIAHNGRPVEINNVGEFAFLKIIYGHHDITGIAPHWCEFVHRNIE